MASSTAAGDPISVYAELLPHIRQISVAVSFGSVGPSASAGTAAQIADGGSSVVVRHAGQATVLRLPGRAALPRGRSSLSLPLAGEGGAGDDLAGAACV